MAGGSHPKPPQPPPSSSLSGNRKSRWESSSSATISKTENPNPPPPKSKLVENHKPLKPIPNSNPSPKQISYPNLKSTVEPISGPSQFPFPDPPPPSYGFHMLERRTIVLADGSVRSYFALPPDYQDLHAFPHPPPTRFLHLPDGGGIASSSSNGPRFPPMSPEGLGMGIGLHPSLKRKFDDPNDNGIYPLGMEFRAGRSGPFGGMDDELFRAGKYARVGGGGDGAIGVIHKHLEVDPVQLKKAFLHFTKVINESEAERKRYLEDGKHLRCLACGRSSKEFSDIHALIMHTYISENADLHVGHLGLHKALCVLMGWNYTKPPDNSKTYQFLPADEAVANQEDLILWPPLVIIHNTITGKGKEGRMEGLGNKAMDAKMRDWGVSGGKPKSLYGKDGHQGTTLIRFNGDQLGLKEALQLAEHFEKENHGRRAWMHLQPVTPGKDDEKNPGLVKLDRSGEKKRILYGYLALAADLYKIDFETRKKITIESRREHKVSN